MLRFIFICSLYLLSSQGFAQNTLSPETTTTTTIETETEQKMSIQSVKLKKKRVSRKDLKHSRKGLFTKDHAHIEKRLEERRELHKKMRKKPSMTDKLYFGHKHKPNKDPRKRKYCQVCQIVH